MKPTLAISLGCPAGIGPEIVVGSLQSAATICRPVIFGHGPTFRAALRLADAALPAEVRLVETGGPDTPIDIPGKDAARAQLRALELAVDAVLEGKCAGLATAPVSKELIASISPGFTGHTEFLAERSGLARDDVTMLFAGDRLVVGLLTTHIPLRRVPDALDERRYARTLSHVADAARRLTGQPVPDIAVAGLNPHAGEGGLLGREEMDIIAPFCRAFDGRGARLHGPIPPDAVFRDALAGKYQGVIAAYHDQALIPLKLGGFGHAVNVTGGLPFVRTSPDHGTAYDLARSNRADHSAMEGAIRMAVRLIAGRDG